VHLPVRSGISPLSLHSIGLMLSYLLVFAGYSAAALQPLHPPIFRVSLWDLRLATACNEPRKGRCGPFHAGYPDLCFSSLKKRPRDSLLGEALVSKQASALNNFVRATRLKRRVTVTFYTRAPNKHDEAWAYCPTRQAGDVLSLSALAAASSTVCQFMSDSAPSIAP